MPEDNHETVQSIATNPSTEVESGDKPETVEQPEGRLPDGSGGQYIALPGGLVKPA